MLGEDASNDLDEDKNDDPDNATVCSKIEIKLYHFVVNNAERVHEHIL